MDPRMSEQELLWSSMMGRNHSGWKEEQGNRGEGGMVSRDRELSLLIVKKGLSLRKSRRREKKKEKENGG